MSQKTMFEATCTSCGKTATVPFKPTAGKPVYCRECFSKHNTKGPQGTVNKSSNFDGKQAWARRRDNGPVKKEEEHISAAHKFTHAP